MNIERFTHTLAIEHSMISSAASLSPANASCETQLTRSSYIAVVVFPVSPGGISSIGVWRCVTCRVGKTRASAAVLPSILTRSAGVRNQERFDLLTIPKLGSPQT